jgi:hypothetical protein
MSLLSYEEAEKGIAEALESEDPLKLYWGLIVCSCFGEEANEFSKMAIELGNHENLLVRTRAAEFLGIAGIDDPAPVILRALGETRSGIEALLILNSVTLLRDGPHAYEFDLDRVEFAPDVLENEQVARRLEYLFSFAE